MNSFTISLNALASYEFKVMVNPSLIYTLEKLNCVLLDEDVSSSLKHMNFIDDKSLIHF